MQDLNLSLYKNYANEEGGNSKEESNEANDIEAVIKRLKEEIGDNPSLPALKNVLRFSMEYARDAVADYSKEFKRSTFHNHNRQDASSSTPKAELRTSNST